MLNNCFLCQDIKASVGMLDPFQSLKESNVSFLHLRYSVYVLSKSVLKLRNKLQCVEVPPNKGKKIHTVSLMEFCLKIY